MRHRQSGFTLIELMIVVAIVGVLAAVAVPAYSDYTVRAKVSEAIAAVSPIKASVADYYYANGQLPTNSSEAGLDDSGTTPGSSYSTDVVEAIIISSTSPGSIRVTFNDIGEGVDEGDSLFFIPTVSEEGGQIEWRCEAANGDGSLPTRFAPANCRG